MSAVLARFPTPLIAIVAFACVSCVPSSASSRSVPAPNAPDVSINLSGEEVVVQTNAERHKLALPSLRRSSTLMKAAQLQAEQMAALNKMAHDLPGASFPTPASRLAVYGYDMSASAENVAEGHPTPIDVVSGWMTSPGHRANIISRAYSEIGAGVATAKSGRKFYAQVFARPRLGS